MAAAKKLAAVKEVAERPPEAASGDGVESYSLDTGGNAYIPVPLESIPVDTTLPFRLYVRIGDKHILFRNMGDNLARVRVASLQQKVDTIYVQRTEWKTYVDMMRNNVTMKASSATGKANEDSTRQLRNILLGFAQGMEERWKADDFMMQKLKNLCFSIAELIHHSPALAKHLVRRYQAAPSHFANHMVNVSVYAALIGRKYGLPIEDLKVLTFAAFVHDIGKLFLPKELVTANRKLTPEEQDQLATHPKLGADFLSRLFPTPEFPIVAMQHHERLDGKGFPKGLKSDKIHLFTKICSIADVFDSLTTPRPYRLDPLTPQVAVEIMRNMKMRFDPKIILPGEEAEN